MKKLENFEGKTAVVTGAASGIGLALADRLSAEGMQIVLADIEEQALQKAVAKLRDKKVRALGVVTNTMEEKSVQSLAEQAIAEFGAVHVLCNNAGVTNTASAGVPVWEIPEVDWDWVMGVNFHGVLYGLRAFIPHMLEHGEAGHIVNTASGASLLAGQGPYGISKHGVLCLTETLYMDLSMRESAIGASVVCPGFVDTQIIGAERNRPDGFETNFEPPTEELIAAGVSALREGKQPSEIANEVLDSIRRGSLYVLPSPAWDDLFRARLEHVLARGGPFVPDIADIMDRNARGEPF